MSEWQDIATAPRDGTQILVWDGVDLQCVEFRRLKDGRSVWEAAHHQDGSISIAITVLTHWMPLPAAPTNLMGGK